MTFNRLRGKISAAIFYMRELINSFERKFGELNLRSLQLITAIGTHDLFRKPEPFANTLDMFSCGEFILRSAGAIEQTFAGITSRQWDDPFEWTLPEYMNSPERIVNYLSEVNEITLRGFGFFQSDDDLLRKLPAPRELKPLVEILLDCYAQAARFQGKAIALAELVAGVKIKGETT